MINKITQIYIKPETTVEVVQAHLDEQNALGYSLVCVDRISGLYHFFWQKPQE